VSVEGQDSKDEGLGADELGILEGLEFVDLDRVIVVGAHNNRLPHNDQVIDL